MKNSFFVSIMCSSIFLLTSTIANAELISRGDAMVYDTVQDLTWSKDANICGKMSLPNAIACVESLELGGYNDWRVPTTTQYDDPSCPEDVRATIYRLPLFYEHRSNCLNGEMESLDASSAPYNNPIFINVSNTRYWTSTPYRDFIDPCVTEGTCSKDDDLGIREDFYWQWTFRDHYKTTLRMGNSRPVWAVRDGDSVAGGDTGGGGDTITPPIDPEVARGSITTNFYIPSLDDGSENISVNFIYYGENSAGDPLWELQENGVNSPAIVSEFNGVVISPTQIHLPYVTSNGLGPNLNIWIDLVYDSTVEGSTDGAGTLWKQAAFGNN